MIYDLSLITIPVSNCHLFSDISISQGSVATHLRCGGLFSYNFTANLSLSLTAKEFWKSVKIWQSYRHEFGGPVFWNTVYNACSNRHECLGLLLQCESKKTIGQTYFCDNFVNAVYWFSTSLTVMTRPGMVRAQTYSGHLSPHLNRVFALPVKFAL